jgi:hypothetical protein
MIGDYLKHQEIGTYVDTNIDNNDFKLILSKVDGIFSRISEEQSKRKKNKVELEKYILYFCKYKYILFSSYIERNSI